MSSVRRVLSGALLVLALTPSLALADVTITWKRSGSARGQQAQVRIEAIKGNLVREDQGPVGQPPTFSAIRDLTGLREYLMWHAFKLVSSNVLRPGDREERPAATQGQRTEREHEEAVKKRARSAKAIPTGATAILLGRECREYRYTARSIDGAFTLNGTFWMPDNGPGGREYARMYERLRNLKVGEEEEGGEREIRSVQQGGSELQREFMVVARRNGIPYKLEFEVVGQGRRVATREEALEISTKRIPANRFVVPKDYKTRG